VGFIWEGVRERGRMRTETDQVEMIDGISSMGRRQRAEGQVEMKTKMMKMMRGIVCALIGEEDTQTVLANCERGCWLLLLFVTWGIARERADES
jgi:hypothetical protein